MITAKRFSRKRRVFPKPIVHDTTCLDLIRLIFVFYIIRPSARLFIIHDPKAAQGFDLESAESDAFEVFRHMIAHSMRGVSRSCTGALFNRWSLT